jgi:hypothetical protein
MSNDEYENDRLHFRERCMIGYWLSEEHPLDGGSTTRCCEEGNRFNYSLEDLWDPDEWFSHFDYSTLFQVAKSVVRGQMAHIPLEAFIDEPPSRLELIVVYQYTAAWIMRATDPERVRASTLPLDSLLPYRQLYEGAPTSSDWRSHRLTPLSDDLLLQLVMQAMTAAQAIVVMTAIRPPQR